MGSAGPFFLLTWFVPASVFIVSYCFYFKRHSGRNHWGLYNLSWFYPDRNRCCLEWVEPGFHRLGFAWWCLVFLPDGVLRFFYSMQRILDGITGASAICAGAPRRMSHLDSIDRLIKFVVSRTLGVGARKIPSTPSAVAAERICGDLFQTNPAGADLVTRTLLRWLNWRGEIFHDSHLHLGPTCVLDSNVKRKQVVEASLFQYLVTICGNCHRTARAENLDVR